MTSWKLSPSNKLPHAASSSSSASQTALRIAYVLEQRKEVYAKIMSGFRLGQTYSLKDPDDDISNGQAVALYGVNRLSQGRVHPLRT